MKEDEQDGEADRIDFSHNVINRGKPDVTQSFIGSAKPTK